MTLIVLTWMWNLTQTNKQQRHLGCVKRIWYLLPMRAAKVQAMSASVQSRQNLAACSYKQWVKRNIQTESQIPGPSEWLGMWSLNLSWRNAWRHKLAWSATLLVGFLQSPEC